MAEVQHGRWSADLSDAGDEIVVFLIGVRLDKPWKVRQWWPVFTAMPRMLVPVSGLAAATASAPVGRGRQSAAARIGASTTDDPALPTY